MNAVGGFMAGSIVAKLLLDKTGWNDSIKAIGKDTKGLEAAAKKVGSGFLQLGKIMAVAGIAAGAAIGAMIKKTADAGDAIHDLAERTGIGAKELSSYKLAAEKSGSSIEGLAVGFRGLAGRMLDTKNGLLESKRAFDALGISVTDETGKLRPLNDVMLDVADRFSKMEDGADKAALAQDLFGRSGMALIPMLNLGAEGLRKEAEMAERLGSVFDTKTADAADRFNDVMTELGGGLAGMRNTIANALIPVFTKLAEGVREAMVFMRGKIAEFVETGQLQAWAVGAARVFIGAFKLMARAVEGLILLLPALKAAVFSIAEGFYKTIGRIAEGISNIPGVSAQAGVGLKVFAADLREFSEEYGAAADENIEKASSIVDGFDVLFKTLDIASASFSKIGQMSAQAARSFDSVKISSEELTANIDGLAAGLDKAAGLSMDEPLELELDLTGLEGQVDAAGAILGEIVGDAGNASAEASEKIRDAFAELRGPTLTDVNNRIALITQTLVQFGDEMPIERVIELQNELRGLQDTLANQSPWDMFVMRATTAIQKVQMAYQLFSAAISAVVNQARTNAEIAVENEYKTRLKFINANYKDEEERQKAVEALEAEYQIRRTEAQRKGAGITKAVAMMGAIVNTAEAVTKALTVGPFIGPILAGIIAALGAVQVALIAKQPIPLATGAAFEKPTLMQNVLVGEKGPEYLLPERKLIDIVRSALVAPAFGPAPALAFAGVRSASGSATVTLNLNGPLISTTGVSRRDLEAAGEDLREIIERQLRRTGRRL